MSAKQLGLILVTGLLLGSSVAMTRFAVAEVPPIALVAIRLSVATLGFAVTLLLLQRGLPRELGVWRDIALVGLGQCLPLLAFTMALQFVSSAIVTIFITLVPLFTSIMAHFMLSQEKLTAMKLAGLSAAFMGVMVLLFTGTTGTSASILDVRGYIFGISGAFIAALATIYARLRLRSVDVFVVTALQFAFGLALIAPIAFALNPVNLFAISTPGWLAILYSAMAGSYLGFLLLFYMTKHFSATAAVLPAYVMPVVSATLGVLVLGELITPPLLGGAILILLGVFLVGH